MEEILLADYIVIGGGISGISCVEYLSMIENNKKIVLVSASSCVKVVTNVKRLGQLIEEFNVVEKDYNELNFPNVRFVHGLVTSLKAQSNLICLSNGQVYKYSKLCICTGAVPNVIAEHPRILGIRDLSTVENFQSKLQNASRIIVVGNGGIAIEMIHEVNNCEIIWAIKNNSIGSTFFDAGTAQFFLPHLEKDSTNDGKIVKYTIEADRPHNSIGSALGPDWHLGLKMCGAGDGFKLNLQHSCEVEKIYEPEEFLAANLFETSKQTNKEWPLYVKLTNGLIFGCDFVVSATGVVPNIAPFLIGNNVEVAEDGGLVVDEFMRTSIPDVYAAGDVCTANWTVAKHWFQMRLWTQARQMGLYAAHCLNSHSNGEIVIPDFAFEMFCHVTRFFNYRIIFLGLFNGQTLSNDYQLLLRMTKGKEFIKLVLQNGKVHGAILIGDTELEETFENLILDQLDVNGLEDILLDPDVDIDDYFD